MYEKKGEANVIACRNIDSQVDGVKRRKRNIRNARKEGIAASPRGSPKEVKGRTDERVEH